MKIWAKTINQQEGVLCFAEDWRDPLMWSHYGDRHRGMCLGFEVRNSIAIDYHPERLLLDWKSLNIANLPVNVRQSLLATKFAGWKYEKERRVIVPLANLPVEIKEGKTCRFKPFDCDLKLVEVVAGVRCGAEWKPSIKGVVEKLPSTLRPKLIKARLAFTRFGVVQQGRGFEADTWEDCSCSRPELHALD